jgi:hypothetical protein
LNGKCWLARNVQIKVVLGPLDPFQHRARHIPVPIPLIASQTVPPTRNQDRPARVIGGVYFGASTMTLLLIILLLVILFGGGGYYGYRGGYYGGGGLGVVGVILLIIVVFALLGPYSTYH